MIRLSTVAAVAALLLAPVTANACAAAKSSQVSNAEMSAAAKKPAKKTAAKKTRKPKTEYMRAAPM